MTAPHTARRPFQTATHLLLRRPRVRIHAHEVGLILAKSGRREMQRHPSGALGLLQDCRAVELLELQRLQLLFQHLTHLVLAHTPDEMALDVKLSQHHRNVGGRPAR